MKLLPLTMMTLFFSVNVLANGGPYSSGTSEIDERELKVRESKREPAQREEALPEKAAKNPRNKAFSESFEKVNEEKQEEENVEEMKNDPFIDDYGNSRTTNPKLDE